MENIYTRASFKNENDDVVFVKRLPLKTKINELFAIKSGDIWIELEFKDTILLEHVELFSLDETKLRVTFHFRIDQFGPDDKEDNAVWQDIATSLYHQVWSYEDAIMNLFGVNELSVLREWDTPQIESSLEINVAHIKSTQFVEVEKQYSIEQFIELNELTFFHDKAKDMETLINEMLINVKENLDKVKFENNN